MKNKIIVPLVAFLFAFAAVLANESRNVEDVVAYPLDEPGCDNELGSCVRAAGPQCETSGTDLYEKIGGSCNSALQGTFID